MQSAFALLLTFAIASLASLFFFGVHSMAPAAVHPVLFFSGPAHRYFPNVHHPRCSELISITGVYNEINRQSKTIFTTGVDATPAVAITFVLPNVRTADFMRFGGAFDASAQAGASQKPAAAAAVALANLQRWTNSDAWSQLSFGDCHLSERAISGGANRDDDYEHSVILLAGRQHVKLELENLATLDALPWTAVQRMFVVSFEDSAFVDPSATDAEVHAALAEADDLMGQMIAHIDRLSKGNFVVAVTGQLHGDDAAHTAAAGGRELLQSNDGAQPLQDGIDTYNISMVAPQPTELYLNSAWMSALFVVVVVGAMLAMALRCVHNIQTAPHIADVNVSDDSAKKNQ